MDTEKELTGYPSIDKPWLKHYPDEAIKTALPHCSIFDFLWQNNKDHLDDIALVFYNRSITYKELFDNIDRVAKAFVGIGVKENDVVTIMLLNQPEMVYCFYALSKIGAITCVINALSSTDEIEHYLTEGKSRFLVALDVFYEKSFNAAKTVGVEGYIHVPLFYSRDFASRIGYGMKVKVPKSSLGFVYSWDNFLKQAKDQVLSKTNHKSSDCAVVGHTTGTTGFPKGIMLSDDACNAISVQQIYLFEHERQDSMMNLIVPFALYGLLDNILVPLSLGFKCILIPKVDPDKVPDLIIKYKPNFIASIPMYWTGVINSPKLKDLSFLKMAVAGGAGLRYEQLVELNQIFKRCNAKTEMLTGYGMSEVGSVACTQLTGYAVSQSVGLPLPYNIVAAFDSDTNEEKKYNEIGELCIYSPSTMIGYVQNEEETKAALRVHTDGRTWMHTGDLGYVDEEGNVFIQGRIKRIYLTVYNGAPFKINPNRIEEALMKNPYISECGVVCVPEGMDKYLPIAFCVLKNGTQKSELEVENELKNISKEDLPEFDAPVKYIFKYELPHTAQGKIDYQELERMAEEMENGE